MTSGMEYGEASVAFQKTGEPRTVPGLHGPRTGGAPLRPSEPGPAPPKLPALVLMQWNNSEPLWRSPSHLRQRPAGASPAGLSRCLGVGLREDGGAGRGEGA